MENDVEIEQLSRINQEKNEKLQKMKMNIQKLQLNMMAKKFTSNHSNIGITPQRQPITITHHYQKQYSSTSPINTEKEFAFNSNLFRYMANQSRPILDNESAVSNFSSVSNINNILNARQIPPIIANLSNHSKPYPSQNQAPASKRENKLLSQIDSLLERSKRATKMPIKAYERFVDIVEAKSGEDFSGIQQVESSKYSDKKSQEATTKGKLYEYKKLIDSLQVLPQHKNSSRQYNQQYNHQYNHQYSQQYKNSKDLKSQRSRSSNLYQQQSMEREEREQYHKKSALSNLTDNQSQLVESTLPRLPPHPSAKNKATSVDRHRALIQEAFNEKKKLESELMQENLDRTQIDLELSDQQSEEDRRQKEQEKQREKLKVQALLQERKQLKAQLERIQRQLQQFQSD